MRYLVAIIISTLLLGSCISTKFVTVEIKEPARITFPPHVVNVVVVDNSYIPERQADSIQAASGEIPSDSARMHLTESLAKYMDEEKFFNEVSYYPNFRREYDSLYISLEKNEIINICNRSNADALVSIDRSLIYGSLTSFIDLPEFYQLAIGTAVDMKAYLSDGTILYSPVIFSDTLFWEGILPGEKGPAYIERLPKIEDAMNEAAEMAADRLTNIFIPYWRKDERWYYSDNSSEMKKASALIQQYKWEEAATIWGNLYEKEEKPVKKARLAFNIAFANECLNDVDNALKWNKTASDILTELKNSDFHKHVNEQQKILTVRKRQQLKLQEQYGAE